MVHGFTIFLLVPPGDDTKVKKSHSAVATLSSKSITEPKPTLVSKPSVPDTVADGKIPVSKSVLSTRPIEEAKERLSSPKLTEPQQALEDVYNSLKCPYRKLCKNFLDTLQLPGKILHGYRCGPETPALYVAQHKQGNTLNDL